MEGGEEFGDVEDVVVVDVEDGVEGLWGGGE